MIRVVCQALPRQGDDGVLSGETWEFTSSEVPAEGDSLFGRNGYTYVVHRRVWYPWGSDEDALTVPLAAESRFVYLVLR